MKDCRFEVVKRFADAGDIVLPTRATEQSAGYDLAAAEDHIIFPFYEIMMDLEQNVGTRVVKTLSEMETLTKAQGAKVDLIPTGIKCKLPEGYYLKVVARSSLPLKHWLIVANSEGIIDADYYSNSDNDGEIFVQLINLAPFPIKIKKGDRIAQGIITKYDIVEDDNATAKRTGGFGSTGNKAKCPIDNYISDQKSKIIATFVIEEDE